jgi:glucan phosphoethanolaminetransferase (alkaline phosphatase superfamily)
MKNQFNRRDFLKLAGMFPLGMAAPRLMRTLGNTSRQGQARNVFIVVFDAWSAFNVSLYGYPRNTTPNISSVSWERNIHLSETRTPIPCSFRV